ncbi:hypothetical protein AYO40_06110 [Planctomycetaceae bacterium SCGC AG-212-D15]|nr:hypothetical protein AYO40_06110 [Planctomycetaceae bacterium SCGC AG-212-D15]
MKIWRDIYSTTRWREIVEEYQAGRIRSTSNRIGLFFRSSGGRKPLPAEFPELTRTIETYHRIAKTSRDELTNRVAQLDGIRRQATTYLLRKQKATDAARLVKPAEGLLERYVWSLRQHAIRKAAYLEALRQLHSGPTAYNLANPTAFGAFLRDRQSVRDDGLEISSVNYVEMIDPAHRPFTSGAGEMGVLSIAFRYWLESASDAPFLLWLEGQPISVGEKDEQAFPRLRLASGMEAGMDTVASIPVVEYDTGKLERDKLIFALSVSEQRLCFRDVDEMLDEFVVTGKPKPFETAEWERRGKGCAYVQDLGRTIWVGKHIEDHLHHSSLRGGQKVLCAGVLQVRAGKVALVSGDSGHYRPPVDRLHTFVRSLADDRVLAEACQVEWHDPVLGRRRESVATFLRIWNLPPFLPFAVPRAAAV